MNNYLHGLCPVCSRLYIEHTDKELEEIQENIEKNTSEIDIFQIDDKITNLLSYKNYLTIKKKELLVIFVP